MKIIKLNEKVESTKLILDEDLLTEGPIDSIKQAFGRPTDPQAKTAKAFKRAAAKTQRVDAKNTLAMHKRIGQEAGPTYKQYKWYLPKETGGYETTPKTQEEIIDMFTPEGQAPEELINAMVVTPNGYISRIGMQKIDNPIRFNAAKHLSGNTANKAQSAKNNNTQTSPAVDTSSESSAANQEENNTSATTATATDAEEKTQTDETSTTASKTETPDSASAKPQGPLTDKLLTNFKKIAYTAGLDLKDVFGRPVRMNNIKDLDAMKLDTLNQFEIHVKGKDLPLDQWLTSAAKAGVIKEELDETLLTEAPNLIFTNDELNNPDSIDFKKIIKDRTDKEEAEKAAEAKRLRKAELHNKYAELMDKIETSIGSGKDILETLDMLHDELVPPQGEAETVAGEIVRAMMRIVSRSYNDGDKFYSGYGIDTCGGSAEYLYDMDSSFSEMLQHIVDEAYRIDSNDELYDDMLKDLTQLVIEYIMENPELLEEENDEDSRSYRSREWDVEAEQPRYEFEIMSSADVEQLVEEGIIDAWALNSYVESALEYEHWYDSNVEIERPWSTDSTTVTLSNLTKDAFDALSDLFRNEALIDRFWDDLVSEHVGEINSIDVNDLEDENFDDEE